MVAEAANGEEAVIAAKELQPDVAIIDISMPGINGIEATRRIKAEVPETSVLVLTMHDDDQFIFAVIEAGAAGYMLKDVHGEELVEAVRAVHSGESVLHPAITHKVLARLVGETGKRETPNVEEHLTDREHEVLELAAGGMANKEIAARLDVSARTVETHLTNLFRKLGVGSRTEAILYGLRSGWFSIDELGSE